MDESTPRSYPAAKTTFQAPTLRVCAWTLHLSVLWFTRNYFFWLLSLLAMLHSSLQLLLGLTCTYLVVVYISIRGLSSHRHAFIFCAFPVPLTGLTPYSLPLLPLH